MGITELSIRRPILIIVIFVSLGFFGLVSYSMLGYELVPRFQSQFVIISTVYPGASPSEVENSVTRKVEDALSTMENVKRIKSTSLEGVSIVLLEFNSGTDINFSISDADRKISAIMPDLPETVLSPVLQEINPSEAAVMTLSFQSNLEPGKFFDLVDNQLRPQLSAIPGVGNVVIVGGQEREIRINLNAEKLRAYGLSVLAVQQAVASANLDFPTGRIRTRDNQVLIRLAGKLGSLDELRMLTIATDGNGSDIRLSDVGEVEDALKEYEDVNRVNGKVSVGVLVFKQSDANAVEVSRQVTALVNRFNTTYANDGLKAEISNDTSEFTLAAADAVIHDLEMAVILVALVMLVFLHSLRNAFIVMVSIPASLITTFIAMYLLGYTLNLMTLLGLSLVIGILVDDSIVVLENIYRHMEMGKNRVRAAIEGRKEIALTAISITLVDVVVFVPIALSSGFVSNILRQFAVVVAVSTLLSLFVSFTVTPMLASRFSKLSVPSRKSIFGRLILFTEGLIDSLTRGYLKVLQWCLRNAWTKIITLLITFVILVFSFSLPGNGYIGSEFISRGDRGQFIVYAELPNTATVDQTSRMSLAVEQFLLQQPTVTQVYSNVGSSNTFFGRQLVPYKSEVNVRLVPQTQRPDNTDITAAKLKVNLEQKFPGVKFTAASVNIFGSADVSPIQVIITGSDYDTVMALGNQVMEMMKTVPGTREWDLSIEPGTPEVRVEVNRLRMAELGLNMNIVGATLQTAYTGNDDSQFREGSEEYDIRIRLDESNRQTVQDLQEVVFLNNRGQNVRLAEFATIREASGPSALERTNRLTSITITCGVVGRPVGTVGQEMQVYLDQMRMPVGYSWQWDGDMKNQTEGFGTLGLALITGILLMYFIMVALYDSFVYPFVVLFSLPLAFVGAFLALALSMQTLSIFTIIGLIMLMGLVAKNAILLVDFANQMRRTGLSTKESLMEAGRTRLRPILMTTVAMVLGMLPIAIATGAGAEWKNGLGWALVGGLLSSMLMTLVVVPVIYYGVDKLAGLFRRKGPKGPTIDELIDAPIDEEVAARYNHNHQFNGQLHTHAVDENATVSL